MYRIFLLFFLALAFIGNQHTFAQSGQKIDKTKYAVLKWDKSYYYIFKTGKATTLTNVEINQIKVLLQKAVDKHNVTIKWALNQTLPLSSYKIQIVPIINNKGQKEVWLNCFCDDEGDLWRKEIIEVDDGGNCFFNVKINLTLKTFYDLAVNGYA